MNKTTKYILIGAGVVVGVGTVWYLLYQLVFLPQKEKEEEENKQKRLAAQQAYEQSTAGSPDNEGYKFNVEGELDYPSIELMYKYLYPKPSLFGGEGYVWVRSSALVDNVGWDFWDNKITKVSGEKRIGKVVDYKKGDESGYAYTWFKVKLDSGLGVSETYGWVRSDAVIFKNQ